MVQSSNTPMGISEDDLAKLKALYDGDKSGDLNRTEILQLVHDYNMERIKDPEILAIMKRYDKDNNGHIDMKEVMALEQSVFEFQDSQLRYTGYTIGIARILRYFAFSSDFGEALRPVVHNRIVAGTYAIAFAYCAADVGWEAYKLQRDDYYHEKTKEKMTMAQCVTERATFQVIASVVLPSLLIHNTVRIAKAGFQRLGRFTKWGPSLIGLSMIPFMPIYLDAPVENGLEYMFHHYGPWATANVKVKSH
jgi:mitochondrial fission process protein 1